MARIGILITIVLLAGCAHAPDPDDSAPDTPHDPGTPIQELTSNLTEQFERLDLINCKFLQSAMIGIPNSLLNLSTIPGFVPGQETVRADMKGFFCEEMLVDNRSSGPTNILFELHSNITDQGDVIEESYNALYVIESHHSTNATLDAQIVSRVGALEQVQTNLSYTSEDSTRSVGAIIESTRGKFACQGEHVTDPDPGRHIWPYIALGGRNETHAWGYHVMISQWVDSFLAGTGVTASGDVIQAQWPPALQAISGCTIHFDTNVTIEPRVWEL